MFFRNAKAAAARNPRPSSRRRAFSAGLEPLEERKVMTALSFHGGPVVDSVQVTNVYLGSQWGTNSTLQNMIGQINGFTRSITGSSYMNQLNEYGVARGSFSGALRQDLTPSAEASSTISDASIRSTIQNLINTGWLTPQNGQQVYAIYVEPGKVVTAGSQDSTKDFLGYHWWFNDSAGRPVYYEVMAYPSGPNATIPGMAPFQQETIVTSHELAEVVTDPGGNGWYDNSLGSSNGEIGDIAAGYYGTLNGYTVQQEWSNAKNGRTLETGVSTALTSLGGWVSQITSAVNADGRQELFGIGSDHAAFHKWQTSANGPWTDWSRLGGYVTQIVASRESDGRLDLYGISGDHAAYHITQTGGLDWGQNWQPLGGYVNQLAVGHNTDGRDEVFALSGNTVYHAWQGAANSNVYSGWYSLGGSALSIDAGNNADGRVQVVAMGTDHKAYYLNEVYGSTSWNQAWQPMGGWVQQVVVAHRANGLLDVFGIGGDNAVYQDVQTSLNGGYGGWQYVGGYARTIAVGHEVDGRLDLIRTGQTGDVNLAVEDYNSGNTFGSWQSMDATVGTNVGLGTLATGNNADGRGTVFLVGVTNRTFKFDQTYKNGIWNG